MSTEPMRLLVGRQLKEVRESRGFTQLQLSNRAGISRPNIANIENGRYDIRLDTIEKICEALDVELRFVDKNKKGAPESAP